jgi:hypothetical protein
MSNPNLATMTSGIHACTEGNVGDCVNTMLSTKERWHVGWRDMGAYKVGDLRPSAATVFARDVC